MPIWAKTAEAEPEAGRGLGKGSYDGSIHLRIVLAQAVVDSTRATQHQPGKLAHSSHTLFAHESHECGAENLLPLAGFTAAIIQQLVIRSFYKLSLFGHGWSLCLRTCSCSCSCGVWRVVCSGGPEVHASLAWTRLSRSCVPCYTLWQCVDASDVERAVRKSSSLS